MCMHVAIRIYFPSTVNGCGLYRYGMEPGFPVLALSLLSHVNQALKTPLGMTGGIFLGEFSEDAETLPVFSIHTEVVFEGC